MKIITSIQTMQDEMRQFRENGKTIGFVPTMGYLHEGHLTLIEQARKENDVVVLSIFVNPLQFGPNEDFETYPRDLDRDENLAINSGVDILFYPNVEDMYQSDLTFQIKVTNKVNVLCGKQREGHFDGVATVLIKLFNITQPTSAYFGMKDAQQVAIVDSLIREFNFPINLVPVETVREEDGLAKSSRNVYLTELDRKEAPHLYEALQLAKTAIENGERLTDSIKQIVEEHISNFTSGTIDYVEILSYPELKNETRLSGKIIIAVAVKFTKARLIDNITLVV